MRAAIIAVCMALALPAQASREDECNVWLCLPTGFTADGCNKARKAMMKRLWKGKNAAPQFHSCLKQAPPELLEILPDDADLAITDHYEIGRGYAALMSGPLRILDGPICNHRDTGREEPLGCLITLRTYQLRKNGVPAGDIFYRNNSGPNFIREVVTEDEIVDIQAEIDAIENIDELRGFCATLDSGGEVPPYFQGRDISYMRDICTSMQELPAPLVHGQLRVVE